MELIDHLEKSLILCQSKILSFEGSNNDPSDRYLLSPSLACQNILKCIVTLKGDTIHEADLRLTRGNQVPYKATIKENLGSPYKIQQIQDCYNLIKNALDKIQVLKFCGVYADQVVKADRESLMNIFVDIREARNVLTLPKRKTIEEHMVNPNRKCFHPVIPQDVALSFFVRGHKLVLAAYLLTSVGPSRKNEIAGRCSVECVIPWINDIIILLNYAIDSCKTLLK